MLNSRAVHIGATSTTTDSEVPKVFVCILSWNKCNETLSCLRSVLALDYPNFRVVVVDNGSTDGSLPALRALGDRIDLIEHGQNLGFTGGCNAGMRHALARGGDYVWLLNNDAECRPETLSVLVGYAEIRSEVGMVSPVITARHSGIDKYAVGRIDLVTGQAEETADSEEAEAMQQRKAETEAFADGLWSGLRGTTGRWEPSRSSHHMPFLLRRLFVALPALFLGLMEADPRAVLRALRQRSG